MLLSLDNQIDPTTGTIKIKARFTNQDDTLFPNQFVNARMLVDTEQNAVVVPAAAVQMGNEGHFVWVLNDENNVSKKRVKIGIQDNRNVVISAGLSAGDRVVTDGIDRLTEGAKVEVVEPQTTVADEKSLPAMKVKKERAPDAGITSGQHGRPSRLFILRPVATTLLMAAILLAGIIGYRFLPVAALPEVDYPTIQVVTLYHGASPDVMTSAVTAPLERQFGQMSGLKQMSSQSSGGASVVTLQFQLTLPLDVAEQEVQAAINAATNLLPSDLPNPPIYSKVNPADPPIMTLAVTSNAMPMPGRGHGRNPRGAEDLAGLRRRTGDACRRAAPCGTRKTECSGCRRARSDQRNGPYRNYRRQRQLGERQSGWPRTGGDAFC